MLRLSIRLFAVMIAVWITQPMLVARAVPTEITRQILLSDGTPAADVKITVRVLDKRGAVQQEVKSSTDENGIFKISADVDRGMKPPWAIGSYIIIEAANAPLVISRLDDWLWGDMAQLRALRLPAASRDFEGVVTADKVPVPNATVVVSEFVFNGGAWPLHRSASPIPRLVVQTDAQGQFHLNLPVFAWERVGGGNPAPPTRLNLVATARRDGVLWQGSNEAWLPATSATQTKAPPFGITLHSSLAVRGRVVRADNHQPINGASVRLAGMPFELIANVAPVTTDANGNFAFADVPRAKPIFAIAQREDLVPGYEQIEVMPAPDGAPRTTWTYATAEISMRAWAPVKGQFIEGETGQPPPPEHFINPLLVAKYDEGYDDGSIAVGKGKVEAKADANGRFSFQTAVGHNHLLSFGSLYTPLERPLNIEVPAEGLSNLIIKMRKIPSYYVRFETADPKQLRRADLYFRKAPDAKPELKQNLTDQAVIRWAQGVKEWGESGEIAIISHPDGKMILDWTKVSADPKNWPLVMAISR
jgi:hypothetical protein